MGLFSPSKLSIHHPQLGILNSLKIEGKNVLWMGNIDLLNSSPEIFIRGTRKDVNEDELKMMNQVLNIVSLESICENTLKDMYAKKGNEFTSWRKYFDCVSVSTYNGEVELTFTERKTDSDYILHFTNGILLRTSIEE